MRFKFLSKDSQASLESLIARLPKNPGVYAFKGREGLLYIGKAANIKERVKNHFRHPSYRDNLFLEQVKRVGYLKTSSEIEALILEADLIKKRKPKYNIIWRDDKNYFYVGITKEDFPIIFWTHQPKLQTINYKLKTKYVGPFVDGKALKQTLKNLRRVFPYRSCSPPAGGLPKKPCLWYQLGRCPAPCALKSSLVKQLPVAKTKIKNECQKNAKNLTKVLQGKKKGVLTNLKRDMKKKAVAQDFEGAARIRDQIMALERVMSHARIFEVIQPFEPQSWQNIQSMLQKILNLPAGGKKAINRIEAFDISNIQGKLATGAMVTFIKGRPDKNFYRKFKIKFQQKPNDVAMIKEVLGRRFEHPEWPLPDLILIDGGKAQLNAAINSLNQHKLAKSASISVLALAKRKNELFIKRRKKPILLKVLPREIFNLILQLRDEAHRFALKYHRKLRRKALIK